MTQLLRRLSIGVALLLSSCTPSGQIISRTRCQTAIAIATQTWVEYHISDSGGLNSQRVQAFQSNTLTNYNGERPATAASGPDDNGVWWAALPPRPTADEVDQYHQSQERNDPPRLQRSVNYQLRCEDGTLLTDAHVYREAARAIRAGQAVEVSYSFNRALKVEATIQESNSRVGGSQNPSESTPPDSKRSPTILYVDPQQGKDNGDGSQAQPFKTIAYALKQAGVDTVIQLSAGTYDTSSGETFPLTLQSGVTIRGDRQSQGSNIVIQGGCSFLSPTWARQDVTLVAVKGSQVQGVTLTNQHSRGTAIWVEAGNPTIERNTFVHNNREGVFVSGSATPTIRENQFAQNTGNGISLTRDSGGVVEGNLIQQSGFGIAIGDRATPQIRQNQIMHNRDGLVINGEARPYLSQNTITNNERDGIVVTQAAQPRLQQNRLGQNRQFDLNNATNHPLQEQDDQK